MSRIKYFDRFSIEQFGDGYFVQVGHSRPSNAARFKHTGMDFERRRAVSKKNLELIEQPLLKDLEAVASLIATLQYPEELK